MSKLDAFIQEKQQRSEEWKAQKTAERDELNAWSDNAILTATIDPNAYLHYLDVQADNPRYSASNILLAMEQNPEITYINSLKGWNELGRSVKREETGLKVRVSDPYIKDGRQLYTSADGTKVHNPTARKVWIESAGKQYVVAAGETITLE